MSRHTERGMAAQTVWFRRVGILVLALGCAAMATAAWWPIPEKVSISDSDRASRVPTARPSQVSAAELARAVAGRRLVRPSQVRAAVKDTGLAAKLLERLKLQSVVQMRGEPVAYVKVENVGVKSVQGGGRLLDFEVRSVEPGRVVLTLEGVEAVLSH